MKYQKFTLLTLIFCLMFSVFLFQDKQSILGQKLKRSSINDFQAAALQNEKLQFSLSWKLSKRSQKGWYLYVPLIQQTINTSALADEPEFAAAVFQWQKANGLRADGIIDQKTLFSLIKYWQSRRIRPIVLAKEDQLLTAPIKNFYDPTRAIELLKVEKETFTAYKKMIAAAINDKSLGLKVDKEGNLSEEEKFLKMISTYRSPEYQAAIRKREPNASRAQIAFISPHFTGRALDIYVGGEPVTTRDDNRAIQIKTPAYRWLVKNAERFGFYPYFYEPWHWEYVPR